MSDTPETNPYCIAKQPKETNQADITKPKKIELGSTISSSTNIQCGDLLRWLCCYYLFVDTNTNSDCHCCSDECCNCDCNGCEMGGC